MKRQRTETEAETTTTSRKLSPAMIKVNSEKKRSRGEKATTVQAAMMATTQETQAFMHLGNPRFLLQAAMFCLYCSTPLDAYRLLLAGLAAISCRNVPEIVDGHDFVKYMGLVTKSILTEVEALAGTVVGMGDSDSPEPETGTDGFSFPLVTQLLKTPGTCASIRLRKHCAASALAAIKPTAVDAWTRLGAEAQLQTLALSLPQACERHLGIVSAALRGSQGSSVLIASLGVLAEVIICYTPIGLENDLVDSPAFMQVITAFLSNGAADAGVMMASAWLLHALVCTNSERVRSKLVTEYGLIEVLAAALERRNRPDVRALAACTLKMVACAWNRDGGIDSDGLRAHAAFRALPHLTDMLRAPSVKILQIAAAYTIAAFPYGKLACIYDTTLDPCLEELLGIIARNSESNSSNGGKDGSGHAHEHDQEISAAVQVAAATALYFSACANIFNKTKIGKRALPALVGLLSQYMDSAPATRNVQCCNSLVMLLCSLCLGHRENQTIFTQNSQALPVVARMLRWTGMPHLQKHATRLVRLFFFDNARTQCVLTLHGVLGECILLAESTHALVQDNACLTLQYIIRGRRDRDSTTFPAFVETLVHCGITEVLCRLLKSPHPSTGGCSDFARAHVVSILQDMALASEEVAERVKDDSGALLAYLSLMAHHSFGHDIQVEAYALLRKATGTSGHTTLAGMLGILPDVKFLHHDDRCGICLNGDGGTHDDSGDGSTVLAFPPSLVCTPCCGQRLHRACLFRWVYDKDRDTCPLCRRLFTQAIVCNWKARSA